MATPSSAFAAKAVLLACHREVTATATHQAAAAAGAAVHDFAMRRDDVTLSHEQRLVTFREQHAALVVQAVRNNVAAL